MIKNIYFYLGGGGKFYFLNIKSFLTLGIKYLTFWTFQYFLILINNFLFNK